MNISDELNNVPGLPEKKPYVAEHIPWDKFDEWEIEDHIEIIAILRECIGTYRRLLAHKDLSIESRYLIKDCIAYSHQCIEMSKNNIKEIRYGKPKTDTRTVEGISGSRQGDFEL